MSEQPTEYGKALIEAVARAIDPGAFRPFCYPEDREEARHKARAALLAACAKLKEPPREFLGIHDQMDVRVADGYRKYWRDRLSQLLTEIGT